MEKPQPVVSPGQDVSPKTIVPNPSNPATNEYFPNEAGGSTTSAKTIDSIDSSECKSSNFVDTALGTGKEAGTKPNNEVEVVEQKNEGKRKQSVSIQLPRNPLLPQGKEKRINGGRLRNASPRPIR